MLDHLREQASTTPFVPDEETPPEEKPKKFDEPRPARSNFLGMNAQQRFILTLLLFMVVCLLGIMFLLIAGKVVLPFLF